MLEQMKVKKTAAATAVSAFLAMASAHAQTGADIEAPAADATQAAEPTQTPSPASSDSGQIPEVIVTAQKRASSAQKTAAAITVFDAKTLEKNGVQTLQDLSKLAPGVSLGQNSANVVVTIRGVSSRDTNEIGDPAVSISTDGFYIQRPTGLSGSVYDLERVEVLRGPQGTLYGRSATGGAINFITAKPSRELEGKVGIGIGNYGLVTTEGMLNLPLGEDWAARVAFQTGRHDGYRTGEAPARAGDDDDTTSARLHLQYAPSGSRFKLLLTGQTTHVSGVGPSVEGVPIVGTVNNNYIADIPAKGVPHGLPNQAIDTTIKMVQLNASYDFDFASLIYSAGRRVMDYKQLRDLDGALNSNNYFDANENPQDVAHELRLVSQGAGRFKWQTGGYYFQEKNNVLAHYQNYAVANAPANIFVFSYGVKTSSRALFGQASYEVVDGVTVDAGLRGSQDHKTRTGFQNTGSGDIPQGGDVTNRKNTYHLGLNWQVSPANLLYAKYSTGYKAGGFTSVISGLGSGATVQQVSYNPETIKAVEVGSKNQFMQRRLQVNLSAYTYDYQDQQVTVNNGGTSYVVNAGKSRISGAEAEVQARPTADDRIDGSIAYLKGEFKDFCTVRNTAGVCTRNLVGNVPVQAPTWQINAGVEHSFDVPGGTLTPRLQAHYESKSYLGVENYLRQLQKAYTRADAMLTYADQGGKWSLQGYVRNFTNAKVITTANASFGAYNYAFAAPRTFGLKLTHNW